MTKVLYVEDEPFLAKIVSESLISRGYDVHLIADGGLALDNYSSENFDICLLDIMLPNKNGYEIATEIRKRDANIPIIFLTAKDQTTDIIKGFKSGANDYMKKPFSMEELIVRIENMLTIFGQRSTKTVHKIGNVFTFHPKSMTLDSNKEKNVLSYRESQILELICNSYPDSIQRTTILNEVWGVNTISNSRNLDVYITKLRNRLKVDQKVSITTLKGFGYQLVIAD